MTGAQLADTGRSIIVELSARAETMDTSCAAVFDTSGKDYNLGSSRCIVLEGVSADAGCM